ncbi:MAG: DNA recombination protein RmuC [Actinobacteria bacterium]|nr:DNA recombination protein RmuC [Actinomycetota bacterium]
MDLIVITSLVLSLATLFLLVVVLRRLPAGDGVDTGAAIRQELRLSREEASNAARELREEVAHTQKASADTIVRTMGAMGTSQQEQLQGVAAGIGRLTDSNAEQLAKLRDTVDGQLKVLQESNERKLDQMRVTVDEKLHSTLEKRLGESFRLVSERLEAVQKGLGEMQNLATGVGDLKRVLTNVKARGTWGEVQLGAILEQILTPDQYAANVQTSDCSSERVEYAIKLPGREDQPEAVVWLPIDAKFPHEDYARLVDATEQADAEAARVALSALLRAVEKAAGDIQNKYLNPPKTTDFAIMFLPTEGLYAEVLRHPGMVEKMQQKYRVVVAGPTTLSAILNSLWMGFRTLAIEQRSSEVWQVLAAVKTEFGNFGDVLAKVRKQLHTAEKTIGDTEVRTRAMKRKLREVEQLPSESAAEILNLTLPDEEEGGDTSDTGESDDAGDR